MARDDTDSQPTLGICIPAYRRPEFLRKCLASIIEQSRNLPVRIFVADDSLTDVNAEVLTDARAGFPALHFEANSRNLGINENIRRVVDMSDTDYVWLIGEDDIFLNGAIERVVRYITDARAPFVLCNYAFVGDDHAPLGKLAFATDLPPTLTPEDFVGGYLWASGFLGACVVRKAEWERVASEAYAHTYYAHVGHIVDLLARSEALVGVISEPCVGNRAMDMSGFTWRGDAFGVFLGFERMCAIASQRNPELAGSLSSAVIRYRAVLGYLRFRTLVRLRAQQALDLDQYRERVASSTLTTAQKVIVHAACLLPSRLCLAALNFYRGIAA